MKLQIVKKKTDGDLFKLIIRLQQSY